MNLLKLPLLLISFYFESRRSPVPAKFYRWYHLFLFLVKAHLKTIFPGNKSEGVFLRFMNHRLNASNYKEILYLFREIFLNGEYYYKFKQDSPKIIFDCGANIGFSVLFFKMIYPESKIYAFEPNPYAFAYLEKNIIDNNLEDVLTFKVALSDMSGRLSLYFNKQILATGSLNADRSEYHETVSVECKPLSHFYKMEEAIDLVKIDVEGSENKILKELHSEQLLTKSNNYLIEYHNHENISQYIEFIDLFRSGQYNMQLSASINRKKNFQDILCKFTRS